MRCLGLCGHALLADLHQLSPILGHLVPGDRQVTAGDSLSCLDAMH